MAAPDVSARRAFAEAGTGARRSRPLCENRRVDVLEREADVAQLIAAVDAAAGARGTVVLVSGEAGIGKTTLVRMLREAVRDRARVVIVGCEPLSVPEPLAPFRDLAGVVGGLDAALANADAPALARALCAACTQATVVAVEDVHWADALTLDVLRLLARRIETVPLVVLATYRDDELGTTHPLRTLAGDLASAPDVVRVAPGRLSREAVAALAAPSGRDAGRAYALTAGNPFLVVELLEGPGDGLPRSVREAALARASRLTAPARAVLEAAAAIGGRFSPALLRSVAGASAAALEECLEGGILVDDGRELSFRHELIRQAVEATTPALRRELLHGVVADLLEAEEGPPDHGRIAHHAALAGRDEAVRRHAFAAADHALAAGAPHEAAALYQLALAHAAAASQAERADLLTAAGIALWIGSRSTGEAAIALRDGADAYRLLGDQVGQGRALRHLARTYWILARWDEAERASDEAVRVLEGAGDNGELALALAWKTALLAVRHDRAGLDAIVPAARAAARRAQSAEASVAIDISVALADGMEGDAGAPRAFERALAEARRCGDLQQQIRALVNGLVVAAMLRDHSSVDRLYPQAAELFDERGLDAPLDDATQSLGKSLLDRGRLLDAAVLARSAHRVVAVESAVTTALEATALARLGESGARALAESALAEVAGAPDGYREAVARTACAEIEWLDGNLVAARDHALAGLALPATTGLVSLAGELSLWALRCGVAVTSLPALPGPAGLELAGDWRAAIEAWRELDAPYEAALAALPGDAAAATEAHAGLRALGAAPAAAAFARDRAAAGLSVPRGPRPVTRADPAGLTAREREVLVLLAQGLTNPQIARALVLSQKTVGHHVSALLRKLGAHTRTQAVARAAELGAQDGERAAPT
jgi:DNA-binding CsgD family transcriptional regulator